MEANENENTTVQNLQDIAKAALRGKYIAIQVYLKKKKKVSKKQPNLASKGARKRTTNKV